MVRMDQRSFVRWRGRAWERLELFLGRTGRRGLRALDASELFEAGKLYRWVTSDLAYAQGRSYSPELQHYLNRLVARSHALVYGAAVEPGRARIARFFAKTFPQEFRRSWPYVGACAAVTIAWAVVAF